MDYLKKKIRMTLFYNTYKQKTYQRPNQGAYFGKRAKNKHNLTLKYSHKHMSNKTVSVYNFQRNLDPNEALLWNKIGPQDLEKLPLKNPQ
jgi:hypothetical protein